MRAALRAMPLEANVYSTDDGTVRVPAREIPVPEHLSTRAQTMLAQAVAGMAEPDYPEVDDHDAWRALVERADETILLMMSERASHVAADVEEVEVGGVPVFEIVPHGLPADDPRVFLEIHGGAFITGGGKLCRAMGLLALSRTGVRTLAVDYRMPPDHPYPAPLDDCLAVYRALLRDRASDQVIVGGGSAGGNLAAALLLRARDDGVPLPAAVVLLTPEVDLTESGDSFHTNLGIDATLTSRLMPANLLYANGHDLAHPYVSPLYGDFGAGFPPTILTTGTRDLFLSNTVRMHRALRLADIPAELHVMEAGGHAGFSGATPEDVEIDREVRRFVDAHWGSR